MLGGMRDRLDLQGIPFEDILPRRGTRLFIQAFAESPGSLELATEVPRIYRVTAHTGGTVFGGGAHY